MQQAPIKGEGRLQPVSANVDRAFASQILRWALLEASILTFVSTESQLAASSCGSTYTLNTASPRQLCKCRRRYIDCHPVLGTASRTENPSFVLVYFRGSPKPPVPRLTRACLTVLRVLHEWGLGASSPFHPYISVLPQDHRLPLEWNEEELELLQVFNHSYNVTLKG